MTFVQNGLYIPKVNEINRDAWKNLRRSRWSRQDVCYAKEVDIWSAKFAALNTLI